MDIFFKIRVIFNPIIQKSYRFAPVLDHNYNHYYGAFTVSSSGAAQQSAENSRRIPFG
jgi:hypothetical protein